MKKYARKLIIEATVEVENWRDEDTPLPSPEQVLRKWREYCGGELLGYKDLAETYGDELDASVTVEMTSLKDVTESDFTPALG